MTEPSPHHTYEELTLPAFPTLPLTVAVTLDRRLVYFPIRTICEDGLHIDAPTQIEKIKRPDGKYAALWEMVAMPTPKGYREMVTLEWEGMGIWFVDVEESRVSEEQRDFVRIFKKQAFKALAGLLIRPPFPSLPPPSHGLANPKPVRGRDVELAQVRERLDTAEDTLALLMRRTHTTADQEIPTLTPASAYVEATGGETHGGVVYLPFTCEHGTCYRITLRLHPSYQPEVINVEVDTK